MIQVPPAKDVVSALWASDLEAEVQDAGAMVEQGCRRSWLTCPAVPCPAVFLALLGPVGAAMWKKWGRGK